jgi:2,3-dihydroxybenzoate decarboxylase
MDASEIEIVVLSQTAPGIQQEPDRATAVRAARASNEFLAGQIARHPDRYRGFACVALQDPAAATAELERCVTDHGFLGVLVNGHTNGVYLDDRSFDGFWEKVQELRVPLYLHPGDSYDRPHMYEGRPELDGATWSWTCETSTHALRLVFGGVFDRFPGLTVILGHMGETLPFALWRLDSRALTTTAGRAMPKPPSQYIRDHFVVTTSGVCDDAPLHCTISALGEDRVMFSVDYPYEDTAVASAFIEAAPISDEVRQQVCAGTAERVLGL